MEERKNENDELIVLYNKNSTNNGQKNNNKYISNIFTILLLLSLVILVILTFRNTFNSYWVYVINFLCIPFVCILLILYDKNSNTVILIAKILFYITLILLINFENIMQYKKDSIFINTKITVQNINDMSFDDIIN